MSVSVDLDKPRELKFDIRSTRELEKEYGKPLGLIIQDVINYGITATITALWVGLRHEDKALTFNLTEKLFQSYVNDRKSMRLLMDKISEAMNQTGLFPTEDAGVAEGNEPAAN